MARGKKHYHYRYTQGKIWPFFGYVPPVRKRTSRRPWIKGRHSCLPSIDPIKNLTYDEFTPIDLNEIYRKLRKRQKKDPKRRATLYAVLGRAYQKKQVEWARLLESSGIGVAEYGVDPINGDLTVESWTTFPEFRDLDDIVYKRELTNIQLEGPGLDRQGMSRFVELTQAIENVYSRADREWVINTLWIPFREWYLHDPDRQSSTLLAAIMGLFGWHPDTDTDAIQAVAGTLEIARIDLAALPDIGGYEYLSDPEKAADFGWLVYSHPEIDVATLWTAFVQSGGKAWLIEVPESLSDVPF